MAELEKLRTELEQLQQKQATLTREISRLRELEEEHERTLTSLRESEGRYRSVVQALDDGVVLHDHDGRIIASNDAAERVLGLTADQLHGRTSLDPAWRCIHPDGSPFPGEDHPGRKSLETGETFHGVVMGVHKPDGTLSWLSVNSRPVERPGGTGRYSVVASFCDITREVGSRKALERSETELRRMLAEKDLLLRELAHRTRNNMAVIRSLLALRARQSPQATLADLLPELDRRLAAMELVHTKLTDFANPVDVSLASYVEGLLEALKESYESTPECTEFQLSIDAVVVSLESAVPFGLIFVELVSNALRHAFPDGRNGTVRISLSQTAPPNVELVIADDGVGMPQSGAGDTLGLRIVEQLARHQLQGEFSLRSGGGVTCTLRFDSSLHAAKALA